MSVQLTLPTWLSVTDWADQVVMDLDGYGTFSKLKDPDKWQDWGAELLNNVALPGNLPDPYDFDDWKDWAETLCCAI